MQNTKTIVSFITGAIAGALAVVIVVIRKGSAIARRIANKKAGTPLYPVNDSFKDFIHHIKDIRLGIEENASELENRARIKMRSIKADFKTVFGNPLP